MQKSETPLYILQHISTLLARDIDQILLEQLGIGNTQFKIMEVIYSNPKPKQKFIAFALGQTEAAISRQIRVLVKMGVIRMVIDSRNRRVHMAILTQKGHRMTEAASDIIEKYYSPFLKSLHSKKQDQLLELLKIIDKNICKFDHNTSYINYITAN
ncbi:MAG TPA: MarR family winged helix-turn-helix transcriptional regulator [Candidatus Saccharimonadales bacterium]|nr:MarR family winged helix-turn-helix transcriptional regulator [Candidatus Saccharimonadales bacterium]